MRNYVYPVATISGSIIGVGFLSLPYITTKVGLWPMLFYMVILAALVTFIHVIFGTIALKTPDFKRWPGFVGFYFGSWAKRAYLIPTIMGSFGVLLAYLIVGSEFLHEVFSPMIGGSLLSYVLLYFAILSIVIYFGARAIVRLEFWAIVLLLVSLGIVLLKGLPFIDLSNFSPGNLQLDIKNLFLPYGAILFSLWGTALIPEAEEMLKGKKKLLKYVIVASTVIPALIYLFFIFLVVSITGNHTTESALVGVRDVLGGGLTSAILLIGVVTTFTAFIAQGLFLKKVFMYDLKIGETLSWIFVCLAPLLLFLLGFTSFIPLISFVGGVLLGIDGILILLIYQKIGGKKIITYPLMLVFLLGMIYSIAYFSP